ncbi:SDR family NAD(P)-dependent oxidoreductase [Chelatococcus asaccharovorans]|uniref:NAD(P)-dependent dehydrogenase (Short-subunit alcohol dehydrogenase family) n=1 Tax=Chelatococcus asaccharovorans TaxID=28210 RepID=A0A2V3UHA2_9HYPH|nr:glucose 1-dehydrogenase [Chelatococcus asaccharovorans]MBS7707425.1 glucose 1-dehydrogenase [Chelatococcus asaccharovorans]PXW63605.1 NAD(P)-dependent dehydrogenase (short-subunit alcohol dehydrogenase family) [Chelatococcus asaccharovorans]CAH1650201.1 NAD(P)-dependent dehydrogenase (Short-subunit alcohol dehydrogenase family) [Chelatococcus asaccharovorans]CAH1692111.1 NAD(P)-dependent dehydrogenase (Short-subunit alcohol dehydrogenase family) [Chelatococcus asaccharovorans]
MSERRVVAITGGTSGIGLAIARRHVAQGDRVVIGSIDADTTSIEALGLLPALSRLMRTDVAQESDVAALVAAAVESFGRLDVMVNNAGIGDGSRSVVDFDAERLLRTNGVLFNGVVFGIKHAARAMLPQGSGSIINIASIAGISTHINSGHLYSAAKAAVVHLTKTSALELGRHGVRVNCICPGYIATPLFGRGMGLAGAELSASVEAASAAFVDLQPLKRAGRPEDIAAAAAWLSSPDASFVTGHALVVDGGASVGGDWDPANGRGRVVRQALETRKATA